MTDALLHAERRRPLVRSLTAGEIALALEVFGKTIDLGRVRIWRAPWPLVRAFVAGNWFGRSWIIWPGRSEVPDFSKGPMGLQAILIHELVHIWQAQQGVNLLFAKIKAGDSVASYTYPVSDSCHWDLLNIEQQAMVVEHRFRLSRGLRVPADTSFYERVCPLGSEKSGKIIT